MMYELILDPTEIENPLKPEEMAPAWQGTIPQIPDVLEVGFGRSTVLEALKRQLSQKKEPGACCYKVTINA